MLRWRTSIIAIVFAALALSGCTAVHSDSVRSLLAKEGDKIKEARRNFDEKVAQGTEDRIILTEKGLLSLGKSLAVVRGNEAAHAFIFSSYQNVATKTGVDAQAVAYLIAKASWADQEGLEKQVVDQFKVDFAAIRQVKSQLSDSWKSLEILHKRVQDHANKSVFASVDPEVIDAAMQEVPAASRAIDATLRHSQQVNAALEELLGMGVIKSGALERSRSVTTDLVDLLERVKK
jgi:hypothetical protein